MTTTRPRHLTGPAMRHAQALADTLASTDNDQLQAAIAEAAHHWLINRHQLARALAHLDQPTADEILTKLQEEPTP